MEPLDHRMSRILQLTNYLDHNLSSSVSVNTLAAQACYSPFHFERVFGDAVGTTPMDYVRQRRLQRVALRVRYESKTSLLQLAHECGFASNASFSRSFRQQFGFSPSDWRRGAWRDYLQQNLQHMRELEAADPSPEMKEYVDYWAGLRSLHWDVGSRVQVRRLAPCGMWYQRFFGQWGPSLNRQVEAMMNACLHSGIAGDNFWACGLCQEDSGIVRPENGVFDVGLLAEGPPPPGLLARQVPGGVYAVLETCNEPVTTQWLHEDWLERQSVWTADLCRPYISQWRCSAEGVRVRLFLPIRPV